MTEITGGGVRAACDLRQRIPVRFRSVKLRAVAQYRNHIAELGGFARVRCPSDAD
ncbi:hypothetical protein [Streptomyces sp. Tu 3180]|uniref:hypothetical protein n=1 Tax=Streptomyces sp. Tu 3180 TaxID=2682611 RepID=UPI001359FBAA|nr:hypothetical protein [Streptomyces sp. Tu 3180]KAF3467341.1 hypothetical protein GL259_25555 [Streptomyces sp. Tu 3180]